MAMRKRSASVEKWSASVEKWSARVEKWSAKALAERRGWADPIAA
jgi:hypothetical protein